MESCPICRANLNGASTCRRCRADLQRVQQIEQLGRSLAGAAMLSLARGQKVAARRWLARAGAVHATPAVRTLARLAAGSRSLFEPHPSSSCPGESRDDQREGAER